MKPLQNKTAIVTGSSRGIGAELAQTFALAGAKLIINHVRNDVAAETIVSDIKKDGGEAVAIRADVSDPAEASALFDAAITRFGKVDILVNSAGVILYKTIKDTTDTDFDRIFSINVKGTFNCLREAASRLSDGGRIINFSSSVTRLMLPTYGAYSATKAAVEQLTRVFSKEIGSRNVTVNAILPGPTNTELFTEGKSEETIKRLASMAALGRIGEPSDIARVALFLASDEAAWITGQSIGVNGGFA